MIAPPVMVNGIATGAAVCNTSTARVALACCESEAPLIATLAFPDAAPAVADKVSVPVLPAVRSKLEGETVTPEGSPFAVMVMDPENPFCGVFCTCTVLGAALS